MDYSKSIMLTSDAYILVAQQLKKSRTRAAADKEQKKLEKEEVKQRKVEEREEAQCLKEERATSVAEAR